MKRSEINKYIDEALHFFEQHHFRLPAWATWTVNDWAKVGDEAQEIKRHGMGWIVTDFGSGDFERTGLLLFVIRNGRLTDGKPETTKTYAEKVMISRPGQVTPWHFHWHKTEDLINRSGGVLEVELGWADEQETGLSDKEVYAQVDGITRHVPKGTHLLLHPGESVTLPPRLVHKFAGRPGDRPVLVGEVSSLNDDSTDNCFLQKFTSSPVEEDVPAKYLLVSEYQHLVKHSCSKC